MLGLRQFELHGSSLQIDIWLGDITKFSCDVIVNATDHQLSAGGGVDRDIFQSLSLNDQNFWFEARRQHPLSFPLKQKLIAKDAPFQVIYHTVGPEYDQQNELSYNQVLLQKFYFQLFSGIFEDSSLNKAHLALPAISCGAFSFPIELGAKCAFEALKEYMKSARTNSSSSPSVRRLSFCLYTLEDYQCFEQQLAQSFPQSL